MRSMRKALVFGAGLLAGVVLMFVSQNMMAVQARATAENFSQFLEQVQRDKIKEVTYTGGSEIAYVTIAGRRFVTTAPPAEFAYEGLTQRLIERGVVVKAKEPR